MKVRLMTFHTPKNYGAILQAYSLYSYIKSINDDTLVIDYNTPHLRKRYPILKKPQNVKSLIRYLLLLPTYSAKKRKHEKFNTFINNNIGLTGRYESTEELYENPPQADIYFTGSDQIFNPTRIKDERQAYYLDFVPNGKRRCSYAGSFGVSIIPDDKKDEIQGYLKKFDNISVRESKGAKLVKDITGIDVTEVFDPIFLYDKDFWLKIAKAYKKELKNYIFYYRLMGGNISDEIAQKISKEKGLPLIVITDGIMKGKADKVLYDVGPEEFLSLMNNADYIVTDSFHGVAFSVILEKQFFAVEIMPEKMERQNTLLSKIHLLSRIINKNSTIPIQDIDYTEVNTYLSENISSSKRYINSCLENTK